VPRLEIEGHGTFDVPDGTRLVRAIEGNGVDILHRCGGYARCTTCRVEFGAGEPDRTTEAEFERLTQRQLLGQVRLSCQILCDHDMSVRVVNRLSTSGLPDPGPEPEVQITPEPVWRTRP
jgi:ferredoxin